MASSKPLDHEHLHDLVGSSGCLMRVIRDLDLLSLSADPPDPQDHENARETDAQPLASKVHTDNETVIMPIVRPAAHRS